MFATFSTPLLRAITIALATTGAFLGCLNADVRTPTVISDGMVLQRESPAGIWGWADPGEAVTVTFREDAYETQANENGEWSVTLHPQSPGGPFTLQIQGSNKLVLEDILVGDLWLASGQSNMELSMERVKEKFTKVIANSKNPRIRYFGVKTSYDFDDPAEDVSSSGWRSADPDSVLKFSAVAYFFAAALEDHLGVPIGIIKSSVGGSPLQAWLSEEALTDYPDELAEAKRWRNDELVQDTEAANASIYASWDAQAKAQDKGINAPTPWYDPAYKPEGWGTMSLPGYWDERGLKPMNGIVWFRRTFNVPESMAGKAGMLYLGTIVDADETYLNGVKVGETTYRYPPRRYNVPAGLLKEGENVIVIRAFSHAGRGQFTPDKPFDLVVGGQSIDLLGQWSYKVGAVLEPRPDTTFIRWKPLGLYNAMIAPLTPMRLKGVIWYQGESNASSPENYAQLMESLVHDWRTQFNQPDLPFIWVQLANFMAPHDAPSESDWAYLRDQQRKALSIPNTGMAVAIDVGEWNDIHPLDKKTVGERLALEARRVAYGEDDIVSAGPLIQFATRQGSRIRLSFTNVGEGLVTKGGGDAVRHFAIAGPDGNFVKAQARIVGDQVEVWSPKVKSPHTVRYAWANNPSTANLYNKQNLPASPFQITVEQP